MNFLQENITLYDVINIMASLSQPIQMAEPKNILVVRIDDCLIKVRLLSVLPTSSDIFDIQQYSVCTRTSYTNI